MSVVGSMRVERKEGRTVKVVHTETDKGWSDDVVNIDSEGMDPWIVQRRRCPDTALLRSSRSEGMESVKYMI